MSTPSKPYEKTDLARFLRKRIDQLAPRKTRNEIAAEVGFNRPNILSMLKAGEAKLPLDRVPAMAKALEADPAYLFRMALEQHFRSDVADAIASIFGDIVSDNEREWLQLIRETSGNTDPALTADRRKKLERICKDMFAAEAADAS